MNDESRFTEGRRPGRSFADLCREIDQDPRERRRIQDLSALLDAEDALYEEGAKLHEAGSHQAAAPLLRRAADAGILGAEDLLAESAVVTDDLTGQLNRRGLAERLRVAVTRAADTRQPLALLVLDLDRFKSVNDTVGHHFGDKVLVEVSRRIATALRPGDTLARLGGDEFAVLLERTDRASAQLVVDQVRAALRDHMEIDTLTIQMTASIGVAVYPDQAASADELLARADIAMYAEKQRIDAPKKAVAGIQRLTADDLLDFLVEQAGLLLEDRPADLHVTFSDIGLDSLAYLQLQSEIFGRFDVELPAYPPDDYTLADILAAVNAVLLPQDV
ncbi:GGDEF domain-containing protein [Frankia sp. CNm7]|nr:GGDEF domain-containing protein [Frankia nepalensis]MBL7502814.1 GGDEF domain-containing protein [Frankia nepalensis]MBL7515269.1 GGDEF domain-containing protein [Frankia nepalensis]MBL7522127.1 GGDEF domain-containing protein [Frankia nepalensis]